MRLMRGLAAAVSAAALLSGLVSGVAHANTVGRTAGTYSVSPTGAATYSIPIWAPNGPHGVQPQIALTYNSQQGNGYVGVGWSVSGLSSIYRCNLTVAQDAAAAAVALAVSDGYCMDGQRLRLTGGAYGTANSTYQTEIANFVTVEAYGATGSGPSFWVATAKNGWRYTYGAAVPSISGNSDSTAVSWQLSEVTDTYGNSMTVTYLTDNANAQAVPHVISWVPASAGSSSYNYTMTFNYSTDGSVHGYLGGVPVNNTNLLTSIAIAYQGTALKTYYLTYSNTSTATSRNLLTQVQECAGTGTSNCLLPTTATYQPGAAGVGSATTLSGASGGAGNTAYDFNGDGRNDLLVIGAGGASSVAFGGPSGYGTPVATGITGALLIGDVDGSGVASLVANVNGTWYAYKWNGSSFVGTSTGVAVAATSGQELVDVDGDGRADLIQAESDGFIHVRLNTSTGGSVSFSSTDINTLISLSTDLSGGSASNPALHFWGDSQDDLVETTESCLKYNKTFCTSYEYIFYQLHFNGSTFVDTGGFSSTNANDPIDIADYNDDGCSDVLTSTQLILSACSGNPSVSVLLPAGVTPIGGMDWDGDGRRDVLVSQSNGYVGVLLSTGTGISSNVINTSVSYASGSRYIAAPNLTGDGQDGLVVSNGTSIVYYLHNSPGEPPDLLASIADGFGNSVSPTYTALAYGDIYTNNATGSYPDTAYVGPMYVVQASTFSDPSATGGTYVQSNTYTGALLNRQGRGFDGFSEVTSLDGRNHLQDASYFEQAFPYTGMRYSEVLSSGTQTVSATTNTLASLVTLSSTAYQQRYLPYFNHSTTQQYEVGGTENGTLITTTSTSDTLDNYGNQTSMSQTVTDNDPNSPTTGQSWTKTITNTPVESTSPIYCANLLSQTQTVYTASSGATTVTVAKTLTPDTTAHCDYTEIVTQPGTSYAVAEVLGYDSFGNVSTDSITGNGMAARVTSANWGATGQFLASVTDASGATTQYAYNSYGLRLSTTDPNGLITSWQYDSFGYKTLETRPDGTSTQWSRSDCAGSGGCLIGAHGLEVTQSIYAPGGAVVTDGTTYYDVVGRKLVSQNRLLASGVYERNEQRYDSLGRVSQTAVPCTWSALTISCTSWVTNTYDTLNRLTQSQPPGYAPTTYAYRGRTTVVTDANGHAKTTVQGVDGTLRQVTDANGYTITHSYDAAGGRVGMTDSQGRQLWSGTIAYGVKPFIVSATDLALGSRNYTVDALGEVTAYSDNNNNSFSATYDALGRLVSRTEPDLYTQWTWGTAAASDNVGKLQSVCTGPGTHTTGSGAPACAASGYSESEIYDNAGRLSQRSIVIPTTNVQGGTYTYAYQYNASGQLATLTYPTTIGTPLTLSYGYTNGSLTSITDVPDNVTLWTANTVNPAGQITEETLGNHVVINRSYDPVRM